MNFTNDLIFGMCLGIVVGIVIAVVIVFMAGVRL